LRILLDTHLLLWWLMDDPGLSTEARALVSERENVVFISAVTMWEIWLKQSLGKLRLPVDFETKMTDEAFENLPLTYQHTRQVALLPWHHRDPFDRMLIAQARYENLILLTADPVVSNYGDFVRLVR
jgi:PIN domain nuclease of toxin-antitoxin system